MAATGPNELLMLVVMFFSGGFGLPLGVPPAPEDELLARVAPEQCLFYTTWAGMAKPDPQSPNQTEQLMAEAEIQQLIATLDQQLGAVLNHVAEREREPLAKLLASAGPRALKTLLTHPAAVFVGDLQMDNGPPKVQAGMLVNAGDDIDRLRSLLEQLQAHVPEDRLQEVTEADVKLHRILLPPPAPPVSWGVRGKYLVVGVGEGAVAAMLDKARNEPPQWLTNLRERLPVERRSTLTYLNLGRIQELIKPLLAREPKLPQPCRRSAWTACKRSVASAGWTKTGSSAGRGSGSTASREVFSPWSRPSP